MPPVSLHCSSQVGIRKYYGLFNATVTRSLRLPVRRGGQELQHGRPRQHHRLQGSPWGMAAPPRHLLVLHPSVDLTQSLSFKEYQQLVMGLLQVRHNNTVQQVYTSRTLQSSSIRAHPSSMLDHSALTTPSHHTILCPCVLHWETPYHLSPTHPYRLGAACRWRCC
jgi:hypothetical protein